MSAADLIALAERVEKAEGPDRELDFEVWWMRRDKEHLWALSGMNAQRALWTEADLYKTIKRDPSEYGFGASYTASLDAAMTLAEPFLLTALSDIAGDGLIACCLVTDTSISPVREHWGLPRQDATIRRVEVMARALTAAALRARAATL